MSLKLNKQTINDVYFNLWNFNIPLRCLSDYELNYLKKLPGEIPSVEWVWSEMDRIWDAFQLDNKKPLKQQPTDNFYSHPVWLMNGVFTSLDPTSLNHRESIAQYLVDEKCQLIADYGGGFGELALRITNLSDTAKVKIIEPFPSKVGIDRLKDKNSVELIQLLGVDEYDAIVAQDVLEHVEDPIELAEAMARSVKNNGYVVFANCFYPVIKCHLPSTFHLRYTFKTVINKLGLIFIEKIPGANHALVFKKISNLDIGSARRAEKASLIYGNVFNFSKSILSKARRLINR